MQDDPTNPELADRVVKALRTVKDPEIPVNIHDLGLIYRLDVDDAGRVDITMTLTAPNCPMADVIVNEARSSVLAVDGVTEVHVELVWEPKWEPAMMSEAAKLELEFTGHTGPAHLRKDPFSSLTIGRSDRKPRRK